MAGYRGSESEAKASELLGPVGLLEEAGRAVPELCSLSPGPWKGRRALSHVTPHAHFCTLSTMAVVMPGAWHSRGNSWFLPRA